MRGLLRENPLLNRDFKDILSAFSEEKVEFLVVGGYAMAFHGYVRATGDIDIVDSLFGRKCDACLARLKNIRRTAF